MTPTNHLLRRYALLSILTAVATIALKLSAYWLTGSVGLLSDALESFINLFTAGMTWAALTVAFWPPDQEHSYGHTKIEYFASGLTGLIIFSAGVLVGWQAVDRLFNPQPLGELAQGLIISLIAAGLNGLVAYLLTQAGRAHHSVSLTAEGHHLWTDVYTSAGVLLGVGLVWLTNLNWLDGLVALLVGLNLMWQGSKLLLEASQGLMDKALSAEELARLEAVLTVYSAQGISYHALRTRQAGAHRFVSVHLQMPGSWSVQKSHEVADQIEAEMRQAVPQLSTLTHVEPVEDPRSWADEQLVVGTTTHK